MSSFPLKQIEQTRKKLEIESKYITPSVKVFLSDFIQQIGNYIAKNGLDDLIQSINDQPFVDTFQDISEKVIENQKLTKKSEKFPLSFSPSDLQKRFPRKEKNTNKKEFIRMSSLLEIVVGDILEHLQNDETIEDMFTDSSNPLYDIFNTTFTAFTKQKTPKKTPRKSSKSSRKSSKSSKSRNSRKSRKTPRKSRKSRKSRK